VNSYRKNLKQKYPDCWKWISLAGRLQGELTEIEANLLFQLARARTPSAGPLIVELGAWQGKTSLLLAAGLRGKARPRVVSFQRGFLDPRAFQRVLRRCNLAHVIETVDPSPDGRSNWKDCIDLLFINVTEDYDALRREFLLWSPFVKPAGIVVLSAVPQNLPALCRLIAEDLQGPQYTDLRQVNGLAWAAAAADGIDWNPGPDTARLQDYMRRSAQEIARNRHAIRALRRSWSWRLTAPLRLGIAAAHAMAGLLTSFGSGSPKSRIVGLFQWMVYRKQVHASGLLDERYYRANHTGAAWSRATPLLHFFVCGASAGDNPNELFDVAYYRGRYPDVARSWVNPLVHYLKNGAYEGRDPHPHFDSSFYLEQNHDVRAGRLNPLAHYLAPGIAEGRDPNPWFDTSEYLEQNPEVVDFALNPLAHQACSNRHLCSR
jgi:predicted O-methyltransferase YrrM